MYYVYFLISPKDNKVFYVGKGKGNRMKRHVQLAKNDKISNNNTFLFRKIKKILEEYDDVNYDIIFETNNETEAYDKEQEIINEIGISNLCNLSLGYHLQSESTKSKISNTLKNKYLFDEDFIEKMSEIFNKRKTEEYRISMSDSVKNSEKHKSIYTKEFKKNISESLKKWWSSLSNEELNNYKKNMSDVLKKSEKHKQAVSSETYKENLSNALKSSTEFKKYNEERTGKKRGKYKDSEKNKNRRNKSILVDLDDKIIAEFSGLQEVCDYFNIKLSTACVWLKKDKKIENLILKKIKNE
jgi:hypothetical protein